MYTSLEDLGKKGKGAVNGTPISQLWGVACHGITQCYLPPDTSERAPPRASLPASIRDPSLSLTVFRNSLKTHLFVQ